MKTILTHQSAQYQGEDILIINGDKSMFSGSQPQKEAQKQIRDIMMPRFKKAPFFSNMRSGISKSFKLYISESGELVISSNFLNKDDKGRNISYDFYCDEIKDPEKVIRLLLDDAHIAGMTPNQNDIKVLKRFLQFYKNRVRNYAIIGVAAIIVFVALIKIIF